MSLELSSRTASTVAATFTPSAHLLGIVQRSIATHTNTCIVLPGNGEITILPERGEYHVIAADLAEFCRAPATRLAEVACDETALPYPSGYGKNINELLWQAAFHASQGRLIEGCSKYDVVQFRHWPNLTRLPVTPNAARICALLTRHPTTVMLIHRMLGIDKEEVYQIYSAAYSAGIVNTVSLNPEAESFDTETAESQPEPAQERGLFRALFDKISGL